MSVLESRPHRLHLLLFGVVLVLGIFLRLPPYAFTMGQPLHAIAAFHPTPGFTNVGFDEGLYREYLNGVIKNGLTAYPDIVADYIDLQKKLPGSILPPVRFLYIFSAYVWHCIFGSEALPALYYVASFFSVLTLALSSIIAWRMRGPKWALGVTALMAFAPMQIHMSQHALVDGFFTFWALLSLWLLWENLQAPRNWRWLAAFVGALALLVLTKENSFFVWCALVVLILVNRWLQFGKVTREILIAMVLGPLLGVVVLILLAGGVDVLLNCYQLSVSKNYQLTYAIMTGDGPWSRYLVDLTLVSPIIVVLAIGAIFRLDRTQKPELFMTIFIAASYLIMCNVKYGMNLRYANMWDMPLRFLSFSALVMLAQLLPRYGKPALGGAVTAICLIELRQYAILCVEFPLYELVSEGLLRALHILKSR